MALYKQVTFFPRINWVSCGHPETLKVGKYTRFAHDDRGGTGFPKKSPRNSQVF